MKTVFQWLKQLSGWKQKSCCKIINPGVESKRVVKKSYNQSFKENIFYEKLLLYPRLFLIRVNSPLNTNGCQRISTARTLEE